MSDENKAPAIHIPSEHQSAPNKTWADLEVEKAAEEIQSGQFQPDTSATDFFDCGTDLLAQHPRVQDALRRLEEEKRDAKTSQEALEKAQMLFELNEEASRPNRWDGQGRWQGEENEDRRIGLILTPFQFMERLEKIIGKGRVFLNQYAASKRVALLVPDRSEKPLILMPNQPEPTKSGFLQVATLQWPCSSEWMVMRFDEYGVPTTAKYLGWRTALLSMIQLGVITEKEAHKALPLGDGSETSWYRQQLQMIRNEGRTVN